MLIIKTGIIFCMLSVFIGALGAHSLENIIGNRLSESMVRTLSE